MIGCQGMRLNIAFSSDIREGNRVETAIWVSVLGGVINGNERGKGIMTEWRDSDGVVRNMGLRGSVVLGVGNALLGSEKGRAWK